MEYSSISKSPIGIFYAWKHVRRRIDFKIVKTSGGKKGYSSTSIQDHPRRRIDSVRGSSISIPPPILGGGGGKIMH